MNKKSKADNTKFIDTETGETIDNIKFIRIGFDDKDRNFRDDGHWMKIIRQRGKKAISVDSKSMNDWEKLSNFIDDVWSKK